MANRGEKLIRNTFVITLGNVGSKLLQIILVPFYARVMNSEEFGTVDILQAIVSLLLPIFALSIFEAVFRLAMDNKYDRDSIFTIGFVITTIGSAVLCIVSIPTYFLLNGLYVWLVTCNTIAAAFWTLFSQYTKAIGKTLLFSINNVVLTGLILTFNILFLVVFQLGITGYMLGYILANVIATLMLVICLKPDYRIKASLLKRDLLVEMLTFSVPLVLNGVCWWLSSFTDRVMITTMLNMSANGLYAASSKIPHLISVAALIFFQAWQISANEESESYDKAEFYGKIYEGILGFVFVSASILIMLCKPLTSIVLGVEFYSSWKNMPVLVIAAVAFSLSAFFISIYTAFKKTKMAFYTNLICVAFNLVLNYVLINLIGTLGAAIATAFAYFILLFVRVYDTRKIIRINCHPLKTLISFLILIVSSLIVINSENTKAFIYCSILVLITIVIYYSELKSIFAFASELLSKKKIRRR